MKKLNLFLAIGILPILVSFNTINYSETKKLIKLDEEVDYSTCTFKAFKLYGNIQVVDAFPDIKVQIVDAFPDLNVQIVDAFPDDCGKWKMVTAFPDVKIQFVTAFPDIKIKYVDAFPGKP